jgi:PAS domain-containing protein
MTNIKRYPGPRPFLYEDQEMFFGRNKETGFLSTLILNNKTTVLQGKSGYGKSSLINAGIIPRILSISNAEIIKIRFYNYDKTRALNPRDTLLKTLQIQQLSTGSYLEGILPENHISAWALLKKLHLDSLEMEKIGVPIHADAIVDQEQLTLAAANGTFETSIDKIYILVFDQFEELFTYPREQVQEFGKELFDVIQNRIPEVAQQSILKQCQLNEDGYKEEIAILNKDLPVKMLFSIRSDRFTYLTYLKGYLPNFLNNTYKLRRMQLLQVREAIVEPAKLEKNFQCPPFSIQEELLQKIIDFLSYTKEEIKNVEVFEMQIICSKLEEVAIRFAYDTRLASKFELTESIIAKYGGIKNKENFLSEFIQNYYSDTINSIEEAGERMAARYFIEKKLIDSISKNRISLDYVFVQEIGICQKTLSNLVDKKIIRVETNSVNGKSFEISHDSLVQPILVAANQMGSLETAIQSYVTNVLNDYSDKDDQQLKKLIYGLSEADQAEKGLTQNDNPNEYARLLHCNLLTKVNYSASDQHNDNRLILKDAFRPVVQQIAKRAHEHGLNALVKKYSLTFGVAVGVILILAFTAIYLWRLSNRYQGLVYIGFNVDSIKNKHDAIALTDYLYTKSWNDEAANAKIKEKLVGLMHSPDLQARLSIHDQILSSTQPRPQDVDLSFDGKYLVVNDIGKIKATELQSKNERDFGKASYAYIINNSHLAIAVYKDPSEMSLKGDSFIVYDMVNKKILASTLLGKGRSLFAPVGYGSLPDMEYDLKRVRMTFSGKLILPMIEKGPDGAVEKLGIWSPINGMSFINTGTSVRLSKDKKHIIIGLRNIAGAWASVEIRDENGLLMDTISDFKPGNAVPKEAVIYISNGNLVLRHYNKDDGKYKERKYWVNKKIENAVIDSLETFAMARSSDSAFLVDLNTGAIIYAIPKKSLVGFNLDKDIIYTVSLNDQAGSGDKSAIIVKHSLRSNTAIHFTKIDKEISSFQYNDNRDAILLQTADNQLRLLDEDLRIKTILQITANDLFQFSRNGDIFYYVLNNRLCIFENKNNIINLDNFDSWYLWLKKKLPSEEQMDKIRAGYKVKL